MKDLLRSEWRKIVSTRVTLGLLIAAVGVIVLALGVTLWGPAGGGVQVEDAPTSVATAADVASLLEILGVLNVFALVAGIIAATSEFRHRTAAATFLTAPRRWRVVAAKAIVGIGVGVAYTLVAVVVVLAMGAVYGATEGTGMALGLPVLRQIGVTAASMALAVVLGIGIGSVVRNQVGAIVGLLVWLFVAESLVSGLAPDVGRWLPMGAGGAMLVSSGQGLLDPLTASIVSVAYAAAAVAAGGWRVTRQDVL